MFENTAVVAFAEAASEYCRLIEQIDSHSPSSWLDRISSVLLCLESGILPLEINVPRRSHVWLSGIEKRFELYMRIKDFLRNHDEYWSEADLHASDGYMTGSLSDDFVDIYFELKHGLNRYHQGDAGLNAAVAYWANSYRQHWRQHLVDARKQLFEFREARVDTRQSRRKNKKSPIALKPPAKIQ